MFSRLSVAERVGGAAALLGIAASFLTWYSYDSAGSTVTVNGFRASLLGDLFFVACTVTLLLIAARARWLAIGRADPAALPLAVRVAAGAAILQLGLTIINGHSLHGGLWLSVAVGVVLVTTLRRRSAGYDRTLESTS